MLLETWLWSCFLEKNIKVHIALPQWYILLRKLLFLSFPHWSDTAYPELGVTPLGYKILYASLLSSALYHSISLHSQSLRFEYSSVGIASPQSPSVLGRLDCCVYIGSGAALLWLTIRNPYQWSPPMIGTPQVHFALRATPPPFLCCFTFCGRYSCGLGTPQSPSILFSRDCYLSFHPTHLYQLLYSSFPHSTPHLAILISW